MQRPGVVWGVVSGVHAERTTGGSSEATTRGEVLRPGVLLLVLCLLVLVLCVLCLRVQPQVEPGPGPGSRKRVPAPRPQNTPTPAALARHQTPRRRGRGGCLFVSNLRRVSNLLLLLPCRLRPALRIARSTRAVPPRRAPGHTRVAHRRPSPHELQQRRGAVRFVL